VQQRGRPASFRRCQPAGECSRAQRGPFEGGPSASMDAQDSRLTKARQLYGAARENGWFGTTGAPEGMSSHELER
jgi:hypothetical protein